MDARADLRCEAIGWIDGQLSGWVDVTMTDADGRVWHFRDKAPMFDATGAITRDADYPVPAVIQVLVIEDSETVLVQTHTVDSVEGETLFRVRPEQLDR